MPRVLNLNSDKIPLDAIYIGRGSRWGNPYLVGKNGSRSEVIEAYRLYISNRLLKGDLDIEELRGKDLYCHCKPLACHGDVLVALVNKRR